MHIISLSPATLVKGSGGNRKPIIILCLLLGLQADEYGISDSLSCVEIHSI